MAKVEQGEWTSGPAFYEKVVDPKRTVKACIATSPDGTKYVSVREWRAKQDGTPYYTRNSVLVPIGDENFRLAFTNALLEDPPAPKKSAAKKAAKAA